MTTLQEPPTPVVAAQSTASVAPPMPIDRPRTLGGRTADDRLTLAGAAVASLALDWLLYTQLLPLSGKLGFTLCWYGLFVLLYAGVTALSQPRPVVVDRVMSAIVQGAAAVVGLAIASTVVYVLVKGWPAYRHLNFLTSDMSTTSSSDPLTSGGITHAIAGSVVEIAIAVAISLPLGLATAVYLTEVGGRFARVVRTVIEAMTALPDLVAGLFVYAVLIVALGYSKSGLAAAIALSITMLPIIARSSEVVLRLVPGGLREASLALGASQWRTVWQVVLPTARPGLATAVILGVARGIGETAPVLITAAESTIFTLNPVGANPMNSLPLFVYNLVRDGQPNDASRAYGAASVLLVIVLLLFVAVRVIARQRKGSR